MNSEHDMKLKDIKESLFKDVKGNVLEIGPGYGTSLKYLNKDLIEKIVMAEPNRSFNEKLEIEGKRLGYKVIEIDENTQNLSAVVADNAPEDEKKDTQMLLYAGSIENSGKTVKSIESNGPYDSIISSSVLCSVDNVESTLESIIGLLKPGGKFYFIEHVSIKEPHSIQDKALFIGQRAIQPFWKLFGGNCHLARNTGDIISSFKEWRNVHIERYQENVSGIWNKFVPIIYGVAEKESIISVSLDLSESQKSMILAGQGPDTIMEVSSRALAFWVYQVSQELAFRDIIEKRATNKINKIEIKASSIIKDWQSKNNLTKNELISAKHDLEQEKKKVHNLSNQLQEKMRYIRKLQNTGDVERQRSILSNVRNSASTIVNNLQGVEPSIHSSRNNINDVRRNYPRERKPPTPVPTIFSRPSPVPSTPILYNNHGIGSTLKTPATAHFQGYNDQYVNGNQFSEFYKFKNQ
ncbi:hypothetical protein BB560_003523 [Smittium megazygosporum]|uniref:Methyltransferase type 11 domain-containing protein n=1 Tax=Smittium megazygosporum TaxID=133381 RepID=A0A2T9ZBV0_9FUNG|nr:hypothetical protein BB560_003523 [Smittium megazygosporum]